MMDYDARPMTWRRYIRTRLVSGFLVLVPLWVTYFVARTLFSAMGSVLVPLFNHLPWKLSPGMVWVLSVVAFLLAVFLVGVITNRVLGRRLLVWFESVILRVPVIKSVYGAAKQVIDAISMPGKGSFQSVVLVEYPRSGIYALGFLTGTTTDAGGQRYYRVFIPTAPNPTTGFLQFVRAADIRKVDMTTEAAFKVIVSGGVIAPDKMVSTSIEEEG